MEHHKKKQIILEFHYNRFLAGLSSLSYTHEVYDIPNATKEEIEALEEEVESDGYLSIIRDYPYGCGIHFKPEGATFLNKGGYIQEYKLLLKKQKEQRLEDLDSASKEATIEQAKYAKYAYRLSWLAIAISILALYIAFKESNKNPQAEQLDLDNQRKHLIFKQK